ncbi:MAG: DUF3276 family protein [Hyphomicrobiales bacterium]
MEEQENVEKRPDVFSQVVRAGKRTYFFDVKATRAGDFFLTITESKKRYASNGAVSYKKHKIYLYKEDFEKFNIALKETLDYINDKQSEITDLTEPLLSAASVDLEFEDLDIEREE